MPFSGNRDAVALLRQLGQEFDGVELIVSGNLGPRGDGYRADELLTPADAAAYHRTQIDSFAAAGADRVTMLTATHAGEAIGVVQAAVASEIPVVIAFTVETDGRLATGQPLHKGDHRSGCGHRRRSAPPRRQLCHPDHFGEALGADPVAIGRIALHRPERPGRTHAELDEAEELDDGDPAELANLYARLRDEHPHLQVLGGRCGTDSRHGHRSGLRDNRRCVARENRRWATDPNTGATD